MAANTNINDKVIVLRREIKNIRQDVMKLRAEVIAENKNIQQIILKNQSDGENKMKVLEKENKEDGYSMTPIGYISSCFKNKNGIPRQPSLSQSTKATLEISKRLFTNPEHSLIGLKEFSHVWVLFVFHANGPGSHARAKVHPPRMNGAAVGVFSTRSPHRPCPIGMSLVKLDKVVDNMLYLSSVDLLNGTPVLDIKPYIPSYDSPTLIPKSEDSEETRCSDKQNGASESSFDSSSSVGSLMTDPAKRLKVLFTPRALSDLEKFHVLDRNCECKNCLRFLSGRLEAKQAIVDILENDPRSVYRRNKCNDKLYYFEIDTLHVTCWFDDDGEAEVLRIKSKV